MIIWTPRKIYDYLQKKGYPLPNDALCIKNFLWRELLVKQIEKPSLATLHNLLKTCRVIQKYRDTLFENSPVKITSGWRSVAYNKQIGGAPNSYHIYGMALDFIVMGYTPRQVQSILDPVHQGGLEFAPTWTHIDIRRENIRFDSQGRIVG